MKKSTCLYVLLTLALLVTSSALQAKSSQARALIEQSQNCELEEVCDSIETCIEDSCWTENHCWDQKVCLVPQSEQGEFALNQ